LALAELTICSENKGLAKALSKSPLNPWLKPGAIQNFKLNGFNEVVFTISHSAAPLNLLF
jgi:hypothetical protein